MLWLALALPQLPLDVFATAVYLSPQESPAEPAQSVLPRIVVSPEGRTERLILVDELAASLGLQVGMKLSAALALANELTILSRKPQAEAETLIALACWAQQFTPTVVIESPATLLLEIGGCLRYFGGLPVLITAVEDGLQQLGHHAVLGCAPTPLAAQWRAWQGLSDPVLRSADLPEALAPLPVKRLGLAAESETGLTQLGIETVGALLALPHAGLARRFTPALPLLLERALGEAADPREPFIPPNRFEHGIDLDWPFETVEIFLILARRLIDELTGFLTGRGLGVQTVQFRFQHEELPTTTLSLGFGRPTRRTTEMLAVLRERVAHYALAAPVKTITLVAETLHTLNGRPLTLFGSESGEVEVELLVARLKARLGEDAVNGIVTVQDHRPERAWALAPVGAESAALPVGPRPGWLLPAPRQLPIRQEKPWHGEPLSFISRAERIESGWWDDATVARDYYVASGPSGARYWIFQDRATQDWWLHGLFG
ncbi:Y-family DNA polymerase [Andreprevotia chitinilytica]|uniref:Y-family DNA polymerase n=1 Tax=Andreprevotia chitinilytica TaxID=396808 RepID=UPI00068B9327|nr:DNA polymerase Y family protein [Andreprevotia chitinilytica]